MAKVLDSTGLTYLWSKIKTELDGKASLSHIHNASNIMYETGEESVEDGLNGCYNLLEGKANSSHSHGNINSSGNITAAAPTIASGDQIIIKDSSASKITNGPTFDGSTITQFLSKKGTWETPSPEFSSIGDDQGVVVFGDLLIQWGSKSITTGSSASNSGYHGSASVTFPQEYKYDPTVLTTWKGNYTNQISTFTSGLSTTGVTLYGRTTNASQTRTIRWLAIGQKK